MEKKKQIVLIFTDGPVGISWNTWSGHSTPQKSTDTVPLWEWPAGSQTLEGYSICFSKRDMNLGHQYLMRTQNICKTSSGKEMEDTKQAPPL